ncbi:MAG: ZIP family metal transporter [bacterium]|nr:ZIP family metal transporter [bacterium]
MTTSILYAFGSVVIVSLISLIGLFTLSLNERILRKSIFVLVALAVGALLGDAFLHLIPEALEADSTGLAPLLIVAGILSFFVLEKALGWHHHSAHDEDSHHHAREERVGQPDIQPVGKMVLISDGLHNLIDGIIIGASFLISIPVGVASTIAIILHEIPQEIGDFGVLLHSGYTKSRALVLNFFSALLAVLGVVIVVVMGETAQKFVEYVIPFAAGVFIYIATADLVPELHKRHSQASTFFETAAVFAGVFMMYGLLFLE